MKIYTKGPWTLVSMKIKNNLLKKVKAEIKAEKKMKRNTNMTHIIESELEDRYCNND